MAASTGVRYPNERCGRSLMAVARGYFEAGMGRHEAALEHFEIGAKGGPAPYLQTPLVYGYYEVGRYGDFVDGLERLVDYRGLYAIDNPIQMAKHHYYLGVACEKAGFNNRAIEQYERFREVWSEADPWIEEVPDARRRLAGLRSGT